MYNTAIALTTKLLPTTAGKTERGAMIWNVMEFPAESRRTGCSKEVLELRRTDPLNYFNHI